MPRALFVQDHMILPFGTAKKWDLDNIKLKYATARGIHFETDVPVVYIDRSEAMPLFVTAVDDVMGSRIFIDGLKDDLDYECALTLIADTVKSFMPQPTDATLQFVQLYFDHFKKNIERDLRLIKWSGESESDVKSRWWSVLLPLPETQIYCEDPLDSRSVPDPKQNFRVDFMFWTGAQLVGVEIDGYEPSGYSADVQRDRMLRRADVDLIHVLNKEVSQHGTALIPALLPKAISQPWHHYKGMAREPVLIPF